VRRRPVRLLLGGFLAANVLAGCTSVTGSVPTCTAGPRLGTLAQAVPSGSYVPCIRELADGWTARSLETERGSVRFTLIPNQSGARPVEVTFQEHCDVADATPTTARSEGVRTSIQLRSIAPRYAGALLDVFPGGCVRYRFDFARGPHIALMEELGDAVGLFSRRELRLELQDQLGLELDP
jgi:hypothetical protein